MKCISCETEVDPKWKHAIDINVCPFCGKHIMEEHLKNCLVSLAAAMEDMQKYPDQLDDWLLSNHNYIKTNSPHLPEYLPKEAVKELRKKLDDAEFQEKKSSVIKIKLPDGGTQDVIVEKNQSEEKTNSFFERAEVLKGSGKTSGKATKVSDESEEPKSVVEKTQHLKARVAEIKRAGTDSINESGLASVIDPVMLDRADPEAVAELQSILDSGDIVASGLPETATGDDDEIPSVVLNMANRANKGGSSTANDKDLQTLREMQNKVKGAQKRLASGKGGFSRA